MEPPALRRSDHLTFKGNLRETRHGWLRLTPAYSVHLVGELLAEASRESQVLDPFCGTGTTALVCAERGIRAETTDINPFLLWLCEAKGRSYRETELTALRSTARTVVSAIRDRSATAAWTPPIHRIERWWDDATLAALGRGLATIRALSAAAEPIEGGRAVPDLLLVAFCRTLIERAQVSFGHQSMSFARGRGAAPVVEPVAAAEAVAVAWDGAVESVARSASTPISTPPQAVLCDARNLREQLPADRYDVVITSPPYPNRMSYIRELRPYMYWLGYLCDGRSAGELDWQAIGGTWGCATSNVGKWSPEGSGAIPHAGFDELVARIAERSPLLSRYVHKYFHDMVRHVASLRAVLKPGGVAHYIVGNSKFYDVLVPVERVFASLFEAEGLEHVEVRAIRKRTSKRELYEYVVSARKPF
ncbi:hypothetical protein [Chondromyces crocatus]|uniref:site-specific DNA-methyltransferase (cytosine-N(4)-specific) n=1 Tax=Chondromyces crocatus TaxID=52 RepID=A0A0K1ENN8_CHOCO|nr:hypothetical protein [Chondromyces crocatus]AKT42454.1 DNA methyltransferase [Chondromyces crocatus]